MLAKQMNRREKFVKEQLKRHQELLRAFEAQGMTHEVASMKAANALLNEYYFPKESSK